MRKLLFLLVFAIFLSSANAQFKWGANAGVNISNIGKNDFAKPLLGFQSSGFAMLGVDKLISVQGHLGYRGKGYKLRYALSADSVQHLTIRYNYLELNTFTSLRCNADENYKLYVGLGIYLAYLLNGKYAGSPIRLQNYNRFDIGVNLSIQLIMRQRWCVAIVSDFAGSSANRYISSANFCSGITLGYIIN